mgnify:CR=1 FL=1
MTDHKDDDATDKPQECGDASPPCFMHEVDPAYFNLPPAEDAVQSRDVRRWRTAERRRLTQARRALSRDLRRRQTGRIIGHLEQILGPVAGLTVRAYWPLRGEPDLRAWFGLVHARGGRCALPVVTAADAPLAFRLWRPGDRMTRGALGIPIPVATEEVRPDIVIAPGVRFAGDR